MKLSKIYSSDERFNAIKFNDGFNVILGKIVDQSNLQSNSHNLGKSTLVELIDFMLLKDIGKNHFLKVHEDKFINHVFFLELKFDEDKYITIRRKVKNPSKIDFKFHENGCQDFRFDAVWSMYDLPLSSKSPDKNPKTILNNFWGFSETLPYPYRNYLNYFLRTQYDYDKVFKLSKHQGADINWKPALAYMLGYNGEVLKFKYELESQLKKEKELLEKMETELNVSLKDLNRIESLLDAAESKRDFVREKIDNFDFYFRERELNKELIESVESRISELNSLEYKIRYEMKEIHESLRSRNEFNIEKVKHLFEEVSISLPGQLVKSYEELIKFNKMVTTERNKFLVENLRNSETELQEILKDLQMLNDQRNDILSVLKEKDSFSKFKSYQLELVEIESEISSLLNKIDNYDALRTIEKRIHELTKELSDAVLALKEHVESKNELYKRIKDDFTKLAQQILNETAILYHEMNNSNNIDFIANISSLDEDELTAKADGYSYKKMLCVCFDLSVLINYRDDKFFKFAYHDGSLESMANTKRVTYLDTVRNICDKYNIQYILTALEDHLPDLEDGSKYILNKKDIVVELNNDADDSGRLFGFSF